MSAANSGCEFESTVRKNNSFVAGFQPRYGNQRQQRFVNINGNIGAMTQNYTAKTTYFGMYAEDAFDATKDFTIVIGGRWGLHGTSGDRRQLRSGLAIRSTPIRRHADRHRIDPQHFDAIGPKIGFVYRTTPTSQLYFNASRAYEAPST